MHMGIKVRMRRLLGVVVLSGFSVQASAALMTFNDQSAFQAALGANSSTTIDFDSTASGTSIVNGSNFQGIDFSFSDGNGDPFDGMVASGFDTTSGDNYLGLNDPNTSAFLSGDSISIGFSQTVHAIGMYFIASPGDVLFSDDAVLSVANGSAELDPTPSSTLADGGEVFFIGLIDTDGFTSTELATVCCGFFEFNLDDIQFASFATQPPNDPNDVPEPAPLAFFAMTLIALLTKRKRS